MHTLVQNNIDQLLGPAESRYFGDVFRSFSLSITQVEWAKSQFEGYFQAVYDGPPRPRDEEPHIGSIEILAFSLQLATYGINRLAKIGKADTNRSFLRSYQIQLNNSLGLGTHAFTCRMKSSSLDNSSMQGSTTIMEVLLGQNRIVLEIDHRGGSRFSRLPQHETIEHIQDVLHSIGYKYTHIDIHQLQIDIPRQHISAEVAHHFRIAENTYDGIGSARYCLLPTDATRIFGQLMQALLYRLEMTDRHRCANIWLRKMQLHMERPVFAQTTTAEVVFDRIREVQKDKQRWKLVQLHGQVGNYLGHFEIAHVVQ